MEDWGDEAAFASDCRSLHRTVHERALEARRVGDIAFRYPTTAVRIAATSDVSPRLSRPATTATIEDADGALLWSIGAMKQLPLQNVVCRIVLCTNGLLMHPAGAT